MGMPVYGRGDTESVGLGDRFAEEIDERVVNAPVLDASGREKKLHDASVDNHN